MNKKKIGLAVLALALCTGLASAAILSYYGQIQVTTTVSQAVLVDGKEYSEMPIKEEATVAGGESFCRPHWLQSQTGVPVTVHFVTEYRKDDGEPTSSEPGITLTYSTQITDDNDIVNFGSKDNELVAYPIASGLTLDDLFAEDGLQYTYTIIDGGTWDGASPVMAVIDLNDGSHITLYAGWGGRTGTHTLQYSDTVSRATADDGDKVVDFVLEYADFRNDKLYKSVSCGYGDFTDVKADTTLIDGTEVVTRIAIQHQSANTGETDRLDSLTFSGQLYEFAIVECTSFILQPGQKLHFVICYSFSQDIEAGTYVITTEVQPVG